MMNDVKCTYQGPTPCSYAAFLEESCDTSADRHGVSDRRGESGVDLSGGGKEHQWRPLVRQRVRPCLSHIEANGSAVVRGRDPKQQHDKQKSSYGIRSMQNGVRVSSDEAQCVRLS